MKARLIENLRILCPGKACAPARFPDAAPVGIEFSERDFRTPIGFIKRSHLVAALSVMIGVELVLLWNGAAPRPLVSNDYTAAKVGAIMKMYHCQDERIYRAIMDTFDPVLVAAVIGIESNYRIEAVSPRGCRGLMQLSPNKLADWKDPLANIRIGAAYLESLLKRFGRVDLAVAAYNAGPGAIIKYGGIPPYPETRKHVAKAKLIGLKSCWFLTNPLITGLCFGLCG